ncbi:MAG: hydroxyacid dehydrogenase [Gammaproteobacteria bacterium RIFCSPHIGHO2_12_FULL_35_23]|nr:MAG: hydroxyacid dehydrogenase [Gammaproteobacteria bacterium RIFCSPHIGHO2_12_FULL_35_23]
MIKAHGYAVQSSTSNLQLFSFERRDPKEQDVLIQILFCGICHSDIHQARNEWGISLYPMVPGHEIVGRVLQVGSKVKKFKVNDLVGVGCMVDSCRVCFSCRHDLQQFCEQGATLTYNSYEKDGKTVTMGGYSNLIVVNEDFVLKISATNNLAGTAPLLCAGITTYSPLRHWKVGKGTKVGIVGLGGLGHMAIKIAQALQANVTVFTTSIKKREDALRLGANQVVLSTDTSAMEKQVKNFDLILDTVSGDHDINQYLSLLKTDGTMVMVGLPEKHPTINLWQLLGRRNISGSFIGGIAETQEMLDFCAKHNITADIELIPIAKVNEACARLVKGDVKYRFVIDMSSLATG